MKRVLVTGGNKGIGFAVCQKLLEEYPDVYVILASRDATRGYEAVSQLQSVVPLSANRVEMLQLDVANEKSVRDALSVVKASHESLFGIVNNAGCGVGFTLEETMATNFWGPRHVCDVFASLLKNDESSDTMCPPRIVNVGSAAGVMFVNKMTDSHLKEQLSKPWLITSISDLDTMVKQADPLVVNGNQYGYSKAMLAAYTYLLALAHPNWVVNTVTPGFIATDMCKGFGATNPPSVGAVPVVNCLMSEKLVGIPQGRFYGSDSLRSPLNVYRNPGDPAYDGPDGPESDTNDI